MSDGWLQSPPGSGVLCGGLGRDALQLWLWLWKLQKDPDGWCEGTILECAFLSPRGVTPTSTQAPE